MCTHTHTHTRCRPTRLTHPQLGLLSRHTALLLQHCNHILQYVHAECVCHLLIITDRVYARCCGSGNHEIEWQPNGDTHSAYNHRHPVPQKSSKGEHKLATGVQAKPCAVKTCALETSHAFTLLGKCNNNNSISISIIKQCQDPELHTGRVRETEELGVLARTHASHNTAVMLCYAMLCYVIRYTGNTLMLKLQHEC